MEMQSIKIIESNIDVITAALTRVNGKSLAHTFDASQIIKLAEQSEQKLLQFIPRKIACGATLQARSGDALPNAYKYWRDVNLVTIVRKSTGWYLTHIERIQAPKSGGWTRITLTPAQHLAAIDKFCAGYSVNQPQPTL